MTFRRRYDVARPQLLCAASRCFQYGSSLVKPPLLREKRSSHSRDAVSGPLRRSNLGASPSANRSASGTGIGPQYANAALHPKSSSRYLLRRESDASRSLTSSSA